MNEIKCPKCGEKFSIDETQYASIVKQVKDKEFTKELKNKEAQFEKEKKNLLQLTKLELEKFFNKELTNKDSEISELKSKIESEQATFASKLKELVAQKDKESCELKNKLATFNKDKDLEIANLMTDMSNKLASQENFILKLTNESELAEKEHKLQEQSLKEKYEAPLRFKD